jgi:hypothetical protein
MALGQLKVIIGAEIDSFMSAMDDVSTRLGQLGDQFEASFAGFEAIGARMQMAGAELSAAITVPLVEIASKSLEAAGSFEQSRIAFGAMIGDATKGVKLFNDLVDFAVKTPFQIGTLTQSAQQLLAMGFSANQLIPILRTVGDAMSALGGEDGGARLQNVLHDLGVMQELGVASSRQLNALAYNGVAAYKYLEDYLGKSAPEVAEMVHKKLIDSGTALTAIMQGMTDQFGGHMAVQAKTLLGAWTNVKDNLTKTFADIGNALLPLAKQIESGINSALEVVRELADAFAALPTPVQDFIIALAAIAAALGPILVAAGGLVFTVGALGVALAPVAAVLGVTVVALLGWAAAIAVAVAGLVALGAWVYSNWVPICAVLTAAAQGFGELMGAIPLAISGAFGLMVNVIYAVTKPVLDWLVSSWTATSGVLSAVWEAVKISIVDAWNYVMGWLQKGFDWLKTLPGMDKILNLGQVWQDAEKAQASLAKTTDAVKQQAPVFAATSLAIDKHAKAGKDLAAAWETVSLQFTASQKTMQNATEAMEKSFNNLKQVSIDTTTQMQAGVLPVIQAWRTYDAEMKAIGVDTVHSMGLSADNSFSAWQTAIESGKGYVTDWYEATVVTLKKIEDIYQKTGGDINNGWSADLQTQLDTLKTYLSTVEDDTAVHNQRILDAYKDLGIKTQDQDQQALDQKKSAFNLIYSDTQASYAQRLDAAIAYQKAIIQVDEDTNSTNLKDDQRTLQQLQDQQKDSFGVQSNMWTSFSKQVSTIVTDLGKNIADTLWSGSGSMGQKMLTVLDDIGKAFVRAFVEQGVNAAVNSMAKAMNGLLDQLGYDKGLKGALELLGDGFKKVFSSTLLDTFKNGLSGIVDSVKNIGSGIGGILNKISGAMPTGGGAGVADLPALGASVDHTMDTALNGITKSGASAGSAAASSSTGIMGSMGGLMGGLNLAGSLLGAAGSIFSGFEIRGQTKVFENIQQILEGEILPCLAGSQGIAGYFWNVQAPALGKIMGTLQAIYDFNVSWMYSHGVDVTNQLLRDMGSGPRSLTINVSGVIDQSAANAVASQVLQQLQLAGVRS